MNPCSSNSSFRDRRVTIFTSPKSGRGQGREELDKLVEELSQRGSDVTITSDISWLDQLRNATAPPASDDAPPHAVVAAGGDGTLSLVATRLGLITDSPQPAARFSLLPMPMGTENLLARHFGYRCKALNVIQTLQHGTPRWIDCGLVDQTPFLTMATFGFDAEVVRAMHLRRKGHIRKIHYLRPIFHAMRTYRFPAIGLSMRTEDVDDCYGHLQEYTARDQPIELSLPWVMCFNLPCYGGALEIEPHAIGDDGFLDVIGFKTGSIAAGLRYAWEIKRGTHLRAPDVIRFRTRRLQVSSEVRVPWQRDGDYGGRLHASDQGAGVVVSLKRAVLPLLHLG